MQRARATGSAMFAKAAAGGYRASDVGLNSMFGLSPDLPRLMELDLDKVSPDPEQPRRVFDPIALAGLAQSLASHGQQQPILVRRHPQDEGHWIIVAGERRWRALRELGRKTILAIECSGQDPMEISLIENTQRRDLTPLELSDAIARLAARPGWGQAQAGAVAGLGKGDTSRLLSLQRLSPSIRAALMADAVPTSEPAAGRDGGAGSGEPAPGTDASGGATATAPRDLSLSVLVEVAAAGNDAELMERLWTQALSGCGVRELRAARLGTKAARSGPAPAPGRAGNGTPRARRLLGRVKGVVKVLDEIENPGEGGLPVITAEERQTLAMLRDRLERLLSSDVGTRGGGG